MYWGIRGSRHDAYVFLAAFQGSSHRCWVQLLRLLISTWCSWTLLLPITHFRWSLSWYSEIYDIDIAISIAIDITLSPKVHIFKLRVPKKRKSRKAKSLKYLSYNSSVLQFLSSSLCLSLSLFFSLSLSVCRSDSLTHSLTHSLTLFKVCSKKLVQYFEPYSHWLLVWRCGQADQYIVRLCIFYSMPVILHSVIMSGYVQKPSCMLILCMLSICVNLYIAYWSHLRSQ